MNCRRLGVTAGELGAGHFIKDDVIDLSAGFIFKKRIGDRVKKGDPLCTLYANSGQMLDAGADMMRGCIRIGGGQPEKLKLIYARVTDEGVAEF
jgi:pyrimidine-nucleoside phosphorylase